MKTMHLYLVMGALICTTSLFAQAPERKKERLTDEQRIERQAMRMNKELLLDDETSAKFLPLYKEYLQALAKCRPAAPDSASRPRKSELTDEELDQRMQACFECQKKRIETKETYYAKFKKILTMRQVEKIFAPRPKHPRRTPGKKAPAGAPLPPHLLVR